jgi:hypothetical protein
VTRKAKRAGTRGGGRGPRLPTDLADAAEAALDDMLRTGDAEDDEPRTQTRAPSQGELGEGVDDDELRTTVRRGDAPVATGRRSKMPLPAPARTTSVHTLETAPRASPPPRATPTPPVTRGSAPPAPGSRVAPLPLPSPSPPPRASPVPAAAGRAASPAIVSRASAPPVASRATPTPPLVRDPPAPAPSRTVTATPTLPRPPVRRDLSEVLDSLRPPTNAEPAATSWTGPTAHDSPHALSELLETAPRPRYEPPLDETAPVPAELPIELDDPVPDPEELVPGRAELAPLHVAVLEEAAHLGSVQSALAASGHFVHVAASGRDGVQRVVEVIADPDSDIDAVIVALPGGEPVIEAALALEPRRPIVIASLGRSPLDAIRRAHAAGADLVTIRPHDVERLAPIMFAASRLFVEKRALVARGGDGDDVNSLVSYDVFERMIVLEVARAKRYGYALAVALFAVELDSVPPPGLHGVLRARAGNALIHSVRDIDIATQLEHERFLVLMPYTDVKAAAVIARRVIAAVASCDPVVAAGKSYAPRLVGAVAGALGGRPVSFEKLMSDATRVLEQARRDGAELAVQP